MHLYVPCMSGTGDADAAPPETPSATAVVASVAPRVRYPPVSALPTHIMSGTTPACSQAKSSPVRPKPVAISSRMSNVPGMQKINRSHAHAHDSRTQHMMSGTTPACSQAKSSPVRPKPVAISSRMSNVPGQVGVRVKEN